MANAVGIARAKEGSPGVPMEFLASGKIAMEPHLFRVSPGAGSGESYSHEGNTPPTF